jgi:hypothetical protein
MKTQNNQLAVTPFESNSTKINVKHGVAFVQQKTDLTKLKVVYEADGYKPGDEIWVSGEVCKHQYAKVVYQIEEGKPFILIPVNLVLVKEAVNG